MKRLPLETQTLYAELMERLNMQDASRSLASVQGSFVRKTVKGREYYYFQHLGPGSVKRQLYIGPRDTATDSLVERFVVERSALEADDRDIARLAAQLRVGGVMTTEASSARVIRALSDGAVFRLGGVLIGTLAFTAIGNMLGTRWTESALRTMDIDVAAARSIDIAVPPLDADVPGILESLEMGFLPVPKLDPKAASTSYKVRGQALRVDLLTPSSKSGPAVPIPRLATSAQPLKFLDYLIECPARAAVIDGGATLVSVPDPARFGLHKLIVSTERPAVEHAKQGKDLMQAAQVLAVLRDERPGDILLALEAVRARGAGWLARLERGIKALARTDAEAATALTATLATLP